MANLEFSDRELEQAAGQVSDCLLEALPEGEEPHTFSPQFEGQMAQLLSRGRRHRSLRQAGRLAGLVAANIAARFGLMLAAQAVGVDVFGIFAHWTDETFHFIVHEDEEDSLWYEDYREELDEAELLEEYLPTWVPEGYEVVDLQIHSLTRWTDIYLLYSNEDAAVFDLLISIHEDPQDMAYGIFEKDDTPVQTLQIEGKTVYLFENLGSRTAVCQDRNAIYSLVGDFTQPIVEGVFGSIPAQ